MRHKVLIAEDESRMREVIAMLLSDLPLDFVEAGNGSDAIDLFAASAFVRDAFGSDVQDHYTHFYRTEQQAYDAAVTDWERRRYFERI